MEHIPGYDEWKLATPWDDEVSATAQFDCDECEEYNEQEVIVTKHDGYWEAECYECGCKNSGDLSLE